MQKKKKKRVSKTQGEVTITKSKIIWERNPHFSSPKSLSDTDHEPEEMEKFSIYDAVGDFLFIFRFKMRCFEGSSSPGIPTT